MNEFGIEIISYVTQIGTVEAKEIENPFSFKDEINNSDLRTADKTAYEKMKKEIEKLMESQDAYLDVNKYCTLHRWQQNAFGVPVDCLVAEFNITRAFDYIEDITARDWHGVVEQVREAHSRAFADAAKTLSTELKAGKLRGGNR